MFRKPAHALHTACEHTDTIAIVMQPMEGQQIQSIAGSTVFQAAKVTPTTLCERKYRFMGKLS